MKKNFLVSLFFVCSFFINSNMNVWAEYPYDKPINIIVPFGPGGAVDIAARILSDYLQRDRKSVV